MDRLKKATKNLTQDNP